MNLQNTITEIDSNGNIIQISGLELEIAVMDGLSTVLVQDGHGKSYEEFYRDGGFAKDQK